jgi:hypothetical protein
MTLFDKMKKTAQDAANRMEESANAIKDKASAAMEGVTDKQTYISASQAIKTKLTEDKD